MQGNGRRVPLGMDSRWRDERAGCTMITGTFGTTTREHQRKKETYQTWLTSTTRRSEYKYGIAMRTLRRTCSCEVAGGWVMKNGLRLWCCGKELWGLGWATDVVCTMYPAGATTGLGLGRRGGNGKSDTGETLPLVRLGCLLSQSNGEKLTAYQPHLIRSDV